MIKCVYKNHRRERENKEFTQSFSAQTHSTHFSAVKLSQGLSTFVGNFKINVL